MTFKFTWEMTPNKRVCSCIRCQESHNRQTGVFMFYMSLCPICGNKRCPKATHHRLDCTNSNNPGQKGSDYE